MGCGQTKAGEASNKSVEPNAQATVVPNAEASGKPVNSNTEATKEVEGKQEVQAANDTTVMSEEKSATKIVAIVGAGEGLGKSLAGLFGKNGYKVALLGRTESKAAAAVKRCEEAGAEFGFFQCDATDKAAVDKAFAAIKDKFGALPDVLIYNAAGSPNFKPAMQETAEQMVKTFQVEVVGLLNAAQAVIPSMVEKGSGTVLVTNTTAAFRGSKMRAAYSAGKFAQRGLTQTLAKEHAANGVHVCSIRLDLMLDCPATRAIFKKLMGKEPEQEKMAQPDDVAETYLYLVSQPKSGWTNEIDIRPYTEDWSL